MEQVLGDLKINGLGKGVGGTYDKVRVDGLVTIDGNIQFNDMDCNGTGKVSGSLDGDKMMVNGLLNVSGSAKSREWTINGRFSAQSLDGERGELNGSLKLLGDLQCEVLTVRGGFNIVGMLNAGEIYIETLGLCRAREIGGEVITVRNPKPGRRIWGFITPNLVPGMKVGVIEGDKIELESTEADIVRGSIVKIGPGCQIGTVEYSQHYECDPSSSVMSVVRV